VKSLRISSLVAFLPLVAGCLPFPVSLFSEQPLGEIAVLEPEEWNGFWVDEHGKYVRFRVVDAENGLLADEGDSCNTSSREKSPQAIRKFGDWYFFPSPEFDTWGKLHVLSIVVFRSHNALFPFVVDTGRARALIEQGQLPGRLERVERLKDEQVILGSLSAEHYRSLFPEDLTEDELRGKERLRPPVLWKPVSVLVKLPLNLDPCKMTERPK
jgi:hypothetical protein